jgi:hypothetical protein
MSVMTYLFSKMTPVGSPPTLTSTMEGKDSLLLHWYFLTFLTKLDLTVLAVSHCTCSYCTDVSDLTCYYGIDISYWIIFYCTDISHWSRSDCTGISYRTRSYCIGTSYCETQLSSDAPSCHPQKVLLEFLKFLNIWPPVQS